MDLAQVMQEIVHAAQEHQSNHGVGAIVITGEGNKAFAAGADIKEMASQTYSEVRCSAAFSICIYVSVAIEAILLSPAWQDTLRCHVWFNCVYHTQLCAERTCRPVVVYVIASTTALGLCMATVFASTRALHMHPGGHHAKIQLVQAYNKRILEGWQELQLIQKPLIAAVNGYALGGGCEVAMMCDIIIASKTATFGQVKLTVKCHPTTGSFNACQVVM